MQVYLRGEVHPVLSSDKTNCFLVWPLLVKNQEVIFQELLTNSRLHTVFTVALQRRCNKKVP